MASSVPEIEIRDGDDFEAQSPTSKPTRGSTLNQLSSQETKEHNIPILRWLRKSLTRKDRRKEQLVAYKQRVEDLETQLRDRNEQIVHLIQFVQSSAYNVRESVPCRDVNVGNTTQVFNIQDAESIDEIKRHIEHLTSIMNENIEERANLEMVLRGNKILLDEIREFIENISDKQKHYHSEDSVKFDEVQLLLQCLDTGVSEDHMFTMCVDELKHHTSNRLVDKFEDIPNSAKNAQRGIIRLVHKFASSYWFEVADKLSVGRTTVRIPEDNTENKLDRDKCTNILVEWVKGTNNSGSKLVNIIKQMDQELSKDMVRNFTKEASMLKPVSDDVSSTTSSNSGASKHSASTNDARESCLPRFESQQLAEMKDQKAHIVELCTFMAEMFPMVEENHRMLKRMDKTTPRTKSSNTPDIDPEKNLSMDLKALFL